MEQPSVSARHDDDEIDLRELFASLWAERMLILLVTLVVGACAAAYAFLATPYYEAKSVLRPAALKDLDELNASGVYSLSPEEALKRVGAELASYEKRLAFFQANQKRFEAIRKDGQTVEQAFDDFNAKALSILQPDPKKNDSLSPFLGLAVTYPKGLDGVSLTNDFVRFVIDEERKRLKEDFNVVVKNKLAQVERKIEGARAGYETDKEAKVVQLLENDKLKRAELEDELKALRLQLRTQRENRIAELGEAIVIAKSLGIHKPTNPTSLGDAAQAAQGNVIRAELIEQRIPLYFMGTEALSAERDALLKRHSDDFTEPRIAEIQKELRLLEQNRQVQVLKQRENEDLFLKDLGDWREEAARLRNLNIEFSRIGLVKIDQAAIEAQDPVKPKRLLVLAIGLVLGGMLGVFIALLRSMLCKVQPA